ncbi:MAG: response regulator [Bryobacteraceae bacterium]|nr:response regulator [Bryobacteraceae bacterium]
MMQVDNEQKLSHLRHDLRTALNHVLGYSEMLSDAAEDFLKPGLVATVGEIRSEAQNILRVVESRLSSAEDTLPEKRLDKLRSELREPLQHLIRLSAELVHLSDDATLPDALRIGSAASRLLTMVTLGNTPVSDVREPDERETGASIPAPVPNTRLLVVDDDEANRDILSRSLGRQGYRVETAESGEEALRCLRRGTYDLVLLDVMMPGMDGLGVLSEMQRDEKTVDLPVVMISAFDEMANVVACIQAGAIDYLFKPFNPVLLRARLAATLERKRLLDTERARTRELESISQDLRRSNEDLERFAWAVSHDLQSPLRTMVSFMQLVQRRSTGRIDDETDRLINDAVAAGKRMSQLIRDLLDYSQLSSRKLRTEEVSVQQVVSEVLADLAPQIQEASAELSIGELPRLRADRIQLRQLLQNLLSNAITYRSLDRALRIAITSARQRDSWKISVEDNGIGIRAEDVPKIFQMFRRLHGPDLPGSGIGLATCQRIVDRIGGEIFVESAEGSGSTFSITIPDA